MMPQSPNVRDFDKGASRQLSQLDRRLARLESYPAGPAISELYGTVASLPALIGNWPLNNYDAAGNVYDISGLGKTLTKNGTIVPTVFDPYILYQDFQGGYFNRADEADTSITGNLTLGGWFWVDAIDATTRGMIGKSNSTGTQRGYTLFKTNTDVFRFQVSVDGTATTFVDSAAVVAAQWNFVVGRFVASTSLDIWVNGVQVTNTTSIPASIFNSATAPFELGAVNNGASVFDGRACLCWLAAARVRDEHIAYLLSRQRTFFGI